MQFQHMGACESLAGLFAHSLLCVSLFSKRGAKDENEWTAARDEMARQLRNYRIEDERVLAAMGKTRRHMFIPEEYRRKTDAYGDHPVSIGFNQTISQPFIVAYMIQCLDIRPGDKTLDIGTGSGYQAAILAELGADVYTIETVPELAAGARVALKSEGYDKVHMLVGDGYDGWAGESPFDAIIVGCAPTEVPKTLVEQLGEGGRMIIPVGRGDQRLVIIAKENGRIRRTNDLTVRFVPMTRGGKSQPSRESGRDA